MGRELVRTIVPSRGRAKRTMDDIVESRKGSEMIENWAWRSVNHREEQRKALVATKGRWKDRELGRKPLEGPQRIAKGYNWLNTTHEWTTKHREEKSEDYEAPRGTMRYRESLCVTWNVRWKLDIGLRSWFEGCRAPRRIGIGYEDNKHAIKGSRSRLDVPRGTTTDRQTLQQAIKNYWKYHEVP